METTFDTECVVIGAGVVGLAVAYQLSQAGIQVMVLEQHKAIGTETSSRNSEVIHAGIYYPKGSLKATLCLQGKQLLYNFCNQYQVPYKKIGKLVIAHGQQGKHQLQKLQENAKKCGLDDLIWLNQTQVAEIEPAVRCDAALLSPSTGIVDSHSLMLSMQGLAERNGTQVILNTSVRTLKKHPTEGYLIGIEEDNYQIHSQYLVNAAGMNAPLLGKQLSKAPQQPKRYCKANYFSYRGKSPFHRLIYPLPTEDSLGIHSCHDLNNQLRFGPDVEWVDYVDYSPNPNRLEHFYEAILHFWPEVEKERLQPDFSAYRPRIDPSGHTDVDFFILGPQSHGHAGLVQLYGIESPGLTSCLAIGKYVKNLLI